MSGRLSSKVLGLRFMQRAMEKEKREEEATQPKAEVNDEAWVIEGAKNRCVVLMEGDPPTTTGRMSFLGFNQATEQLQKDADRRERTAGEEGITVTDEEMAAKLARREKRKAAASRAGAGEGSQKTGGFKKPREFQGDARSKPKKKTKTAEV